MDSPGKTRAGSVEKRLAAARASGLPATRRSRRTHPTSSNRDSSPVLTPLETGSSGQQRWLSPERALPEILECVARVQSRNKPAESSHEREFRDAKWEWITDVSLSLAT